MALLQSLMTTRESPLENEMQIRLVRRLLTRTLLAIHVLLIVAGVAHAISLSEYEQHLKQAVTALDSLAQSDEGETTSAYGARDVETVRRVRNLLPATETVTAQGMNFKADNAWLHQELDKYAADNSLARYDLLRQITERLKALEDRVTELEHPKTSTNANKAEDSRKLAEILSRPEYAHKVEAENALSRLLKRLLEWIKSWLPQPKPLSPGRASFLSKIAQWLVIILGLSVLVFVLRLFLPRLLRGGSPRKKKKEKARIVLGERLEAGQSAHDLLSEAEALARRGELRAAIRRAYIALLVELGDRKIISLAQYKTNRDYLRAMRDLEPLYRNVKQLTDSFERHWYGLAQADERDWLNFRSAYDQAMR